MRPAHPVKGISARIREIPPALPLRKGSEGIRTRLKTELPGLPRSQALLGNACREALPPLLGHRGRAFR